MSDCLIGEDFKNGQGIPFIALEGEGKDSKFRLTEEAKEFLHTLKAPIALASIVGKYRTGKSLLVNRMLLDVKGGGFQVGATVNSCTKGLWIWNKPLRCKQADGTEMQLLIIDTEGIGSLDADADHDAKIFALALLLSSYFIYNSVGSIDENALNALSLVVELTKHIKTKSEKDSAGEAETGAEFANFFPSFLWVIRDFTLMLVDENGSAFSSKTYLERALTPMQGFSEGVEVKNRIRRMLLAFFPQRDCVTLKRPVEDESLLQALDNSDWDQFRPEFVEQVKILRRKIYTSAPAKVLNGKVLDGFMLSHLADQYALSINSGASLNIGDAWTQVSASKNAKAVSDAVDSYQRAAKDLEKGMPLAVAALEEWHAETFKHAGKVFRSECMGTGSEVDEFVGQMTDKIKEVYLALKDTNTRVARAAAAEAIEKAYAELAAKVEGSKLASFKEYEEERQVVRKTYLDTCPDTPAKMEVLSAFMETKLPLACIALAAQVAEKHQEALAEKEAGLKKAAHELEAHKKQAAGELEEVSTRLTQAQASLAEVGGRETELKAEVERQRLSHAKQLEEETGSLKKQLSDVKEELEGELEAAGKKAKEAAAKAAAETSEMSTKLALLEQQGRFAAEEKERLAQQQADAAAALDTLKAAQKKLEAELAEARKEAHTQADAGKEVERQLKASQAETADARAQLEKIGASAKDLGAEKDRTAQQLADALAAAAAEAKKLAAEEAARTELQKELAAAKEQAGLLAKAKLDAENMLQEYKSSAGAAGSVAEKEIQALQKSLADAADKAAALSADKAAAQAQAEAAEKAAEAATRKSADAEAKVAAAEAEAAAGKEQVAAAEERAKAAGKAAEEAKAAAAQEVKAAEEAKAEAAAAQAKAAAATAVAAASPPPPSPAAEGRTQIAHSEEMRTVLERQSRMQAEFNDEATKLNSRIQELEQECDRYKTVIHKLSNKVEAANAAGFANPDGAEMLEKIGATFGSAIRSQTSRLQGKENGTPHASPSIPSEMSSLSASRAKDSSRDSYVLVDAGGSQDRNSRVRNQIVFKPNVTPDVFSQVAKQTGKSTEEVMRNHEAGKASGGVAAVGVGSGEKFSFARLRQAISKKVSGAINKVDEWADNVEGVLLGTPNGTPLAGGIGAVGTPPRPSEGGFYTDEASATPEERREAARVLQGLRSPGDPDKVAAGRAKIEQMKAAQNSKGGL